MIGVNVGLLAAMCVNGSSCAGRRERDSLSAAKEPGPPIRIGMYVGPGTDPEPLVKALRGWGFHVSPLQEADLKDLNHDALDVLYLPGGWYRFDKETNDAIVNFVKEGGGCVGTCAGAYLVAGYIPVIPGRVLRAEMRGRLYLEPQAGDHPILRGAVQRCVRHSGRKWEPIAMTHLGGPMILPEDRSTIVASYDFEGELGAIVAASVGRGRAVALASHPELRLADLPADDPVRADQKPLPQGDARLILLNAVLWAAKREVPVPKEAEENPGK
jgi:glutamine amidotransferase-like uncharacterized protein